MLQLQQQHHQQQHSHPLNPLSLLSGFPFPPLIPHPQQTISGGLSTSSPSSSSSSSGSSGIIRGNNNNGSTNNNNNNHTSFQIHQFPLSHQNLRFPFTTTTNNHFNLEGIPNNANNNSGQGSSSSTSTSCEMAARLILMNIKWIKSVPAFVSLPMRDQFLLLEESWRELFVLSASQFNLPLNLDGGIETFDESDNEMQGNCIIAGNLLLNY